MPPKEGTGLFGLAVLGGLGLLLLGVFKRDGGGGGGGLGVSGGPRPPLPELPPQADERAQTVIEEQGADGTGGASETDTYDVGGVTTRTRNIETTLDRNVATVQKQEELSDLRGGGGGTSSFTVKEESATETGGADRQTAERTRDIKQKQEELAIQR